MSTKIVFIDWEYSTLGDPLIDLAYLITQNELSANIQKLITDSYTTKVKIPNYDDLYIYCKLMNLMSGLWGFLQASRIEQMPLEERKGHPPSEEFLKLGLKQFREINLNKKPK